MWTCTACRQAFPSYAEQRDHFRLDWHRYNLKRKVVELPPVSEEQFELRMRNVREENAAQRGNDPKAKQRARKEQLQKTGVKVGLKCVACNKTFTNANAHDNHLMSKKHLANAKHRPEIASSVETVEKHMDVWTHEESGSGKHAKPPMTEEELVLEMEEYKKHVPLEKEDCIFCLHRAGSFDANVEHMLHAHGFFIPDVEFLVDAQGLVGYLAEKVKVGFYCLYCNGKGKTFRSHQDVQKHMTSLSHCKLRYEDEDLEELLEFYNFEAQYASSTKSAAVASEDVEWETDSEASSIDSEEEVVEEEQHLGGDSDHGGDDDKFAMGVSETGELVLASGRRLGRREFRRYYKQRFRPDETRASVLAATKENLLLAYETAGVDPRSGSTALSSAFVANFLKKRNNIAGGMSIVEAKRKTFWHEKNRSRLDNRSHKLQRNPNRRVMVTV